MNLSGDRKLTTRNDGGCYKVVVQSVMRKFGMQPLKGANKGFRFHSITL